MRPIDADALLQKVKAKIKSGEYLEFSSVTHILRDIADAPIVKSEHEPNGAAIFYSFCPNCGARMDGGKNDEQHR